ncbi:MAG: hypothetical protein V5A25_13675, partial [Halovenus sp.]
MSGDSGEALAYVSDVAGRTVPEEFDTYRISNILGNVQSAVCDGLSLPETDRVKWSCLIGVFSELEMSTSVLLVDSIYLNEMGSYRNYWGGDSEEHPGRGQSETLGFVLLFGIVLVGALVIVGLGVSAIGDVEQDLSTDRAEKTLTQFNAQAGIVALGRADAQRMSLPSGDKGQYQVNEDKGWMKVTAINTTGGEETIMNTTLGSVSYENGETQIAYQGGGVWRASDAGGTMVSPPEFHYRDGTLTLPAVNITGSGQVDGELTVTH